MSNGIKEFFGDGFDAIRGFGEKIGKARYKDGEPMSESDKNVLLENIRATKFDKKKRDAEAANISLTPELEASFYRDAEEEALSDIKDLEGQQLSFFGQMTTPKSLATAGGIIASILAARESQRRYDDYMASKPKYDPGQNPYMANGGGIQSFADGNEVRPFSKQSLRDMMIMNMKEKPMSAMIKTMTAIDSPEILMALLGMNQGGGIQSFKYGGTDGSVGQFPYNEAQRFTGTVKGPGNGQSDDIPAFLSNNEHVITKQEVETIGKVYGGGVDRGHEVLYALRGGIKDLGDKMGVSYK